jgi:putative sigma-54 modulation protein
MTIEYTGRQTDVPEAIRKLAERRIAKLSRALRGITRVHVILTADKHRQGAEVSIHSAHLDLSAAEVTGDLGVSLATALDKLERQAARHLGRIRERKRRGRSRSADWAPPQAAPKETTPRVIRSRRSILKPMTIDEAVLESRLSNEGLVVFRDAKTERVTVLYRRKDGNLGLIEPEV